MRKRSKRYKAIEKDKTIEKKIYKNRIRIKKSL